MVLWYRSAKNENFYNYLAVPTGARPGHLAPLPQANEYIIRLKKLKQLGKYLGIMDFLTPRADQMDRGKAWGIRSWGAFGASRLLLSGLHLSAVGLNAPVPIG